jgi:prolyl-tRNA synthetase
MVTVTIAGRKELEEPYVIRRISETMVGYIFSKWIQSWRDLPVLIHWS